MAVTCSKELIQRAKELKHPLITFSFDARHVPAADLPPGAKFSSVKISTALPPHIAAKVLSAMIEAEKERKAESEGRDE